VTSLFAPAARTADLRPATFDMRLEAVSVFLSFVERSGLLQRSDDPAVLVTEVTIQAFVDEQHARGVLNTTIRIRLEALAHALRMMFPERDFTFVRRPAGRSLDRALPNRPRRVEVRDHREIIAQAQEHHRQGLAGIGYANGRIALRNAALIALVAWQGTRLSAVAAMEVTDLVRKDGRYWVNLDNNHTKMGRSYHCPLPEELTPIFDDYLAIARPALCRSGTTRLWVGIDGGPLSKQGLSLVFRTRTESWFGVARGPHWCRKCITTTVRLVAPDLAMDAALVLDHSLAVANAHYDMAKGVSAAERHNKRMTKKMEQTAARADAVFRKLLAKEDFHRLRRRPDQW